VDVRCSLCSVLLDRKWEEYDRVVRSVTNHTPIQSTFFCVQPSFMGLHLTIGSWMEVCNYRPTPGIPVSLARRSIRHHVTKRGSNIETNHDHGARGGVFIPPGTMVASSSARRGERGDLRGSQSVSFRFVNESRGVIRAVNPDCGLGSGLGLSLVRKRGHVFPGHLACSTSLRYCRTFIPGCPRVIAQREARSSGLA